MHKTSNNKKERLLKKKEDHGESQYLAVGIAKRRKESEVLPLRPNLHPLPVSQAEVILPIMSDKLVTGRTKKDTILKKVGTSKRNKGKRVEFEQIEPVLKVQVNDSMQLLLINQFSAITYP